MNERILEIEKIENEIETKLEDIKRVRDSQIRVLASKIEDTKVRADCRIRRLEQKKKENEATKKILRDEGYYDLSLRDRPNTTDMDTTLDEGQGKLTKNAKSRTVVFHRAAAAICKEHPNGISERDLKRQIMERTGMEEQQCWDAYDFARSSGVLGRLPDGLIIYKENLR